MTGGRLWRSLTRSLPFVLPITFIHSPKSGHRIFAVPIFVHLPEDARGTFPPNMTPFTAEVLGTMILVTLGDGVVANVLLNKSKGQNGGWIVITAGWAFAVTIAVYCTVAMSGAHLNPAVTIGMAAIGKFSWSLVPGYLAAQMIGGILAGTLVWLALAGDQRPGDKARRLLHRTPRYGMRPQLCSPRSSAPACS